MFISRSRQIFFSTIILLLMWLNQATFSSWPISLAIGAIFLIWFSWLLGVKLIYSRTTILNITLGFLFLNALYAIIGGSIYYLSHLSWPLPPIISTAIALGIMLIRPISSPNNPTTAKKKSTGINLKLLIIIYGVLTSISFIYLISNRNFEPVRGPWEILNHLYLSLFGITTLIWLIILKLSRSDSLTIALSITQTAIATLLGAIVFPIGLGFDPLLHEAALKNIITTGLIIPKTIYYLGEYAIITHFHYLTGLSVSLINRLLTPLLFSVTIPPLILHLMGEKLITPIYRLGIAMTFILMIPFAEFTITTPQGLANIFSLATIFWWLHYFQYRTRPNLILLIILVIAGLITHPLAGLPLIFWLFIITTPKRLSRNIYPPVLKRLSWTTLALLSSLLVPITIYFNALAGGSLKVNLRWPEITDITFTNLWRIETFNFIKQFNIFFDLIYIYRYNFSLIFLLLAIIGWWYAKKNNHLAGISMLLVGFSISFLGSAWLLLFFDFNNLIYYEQQDFSERLFKVALYFLWPLIFLAIHELNKRINASRIKLASTFFLLLISGIITSVMYLSYPRYDSYELIRSFNTSRYDLEAVKKIDGSTNGNYVVLANQAVSAAAIKELGFKHYYKEYFFYPLPTGGKLYNIYLDMVYNAPSRIKAAEASQLTGVNDIYFILNNYWFDYENIKSRAKAEADYWEEIDHGKITIFQYKF